VPRNVSIGGRFFAKEAAKHKYDGTMCLPKTEFPMRANAVQREVKLQEKCTDRVYRWQLENNEASKPFVLHDGPPYANGPFSPPNTLLILCDG